MPFGILRLLYFQLLGLIEVEGAANRVAREFRSNEGLSS